MHAVAAIFLAVLVAWAPQLALAQVCYLSAEVPAPAPNRFDQVHLVGGKFGWIIAEVNNLYRLHPDGRKLERLEDFDDPSFTRLENGKILVSSHNKMKLARREGDHLEEASTLSTGQWRAVFGNEESSMLLEAAHGIFRLNPRTGAITSPSGPQPLNISNIFAGSGHSFLVMAGNGIFVVDAEVSTINKVGSRTEGMSRAIPLAGSPHWISILPSGHILLLRHTHENGASFPSEIRGRLRKSYALEPNKLWLIRTDDGYYWLDTEIMRTGSVLSRDYAITDLWSLTPNKSWILKIQNSLVVIEKANPGIKITNQYDMEKSFRMHSRGDRVVVSNQQGTYIFTDAGVLKKIAVAEAEPLSYASNAGWLFFLRDRNELLAVNQDGATDVVLSTSNNFGWVAALNERKDLYAIDADRLLRISRTDHSIKVVFKAPGSLRLAEWYIPYPDYTDMGSTLLHSGSSYHFVNLDEENVQTVSGLNGLVKRVINLPDSNDLLVETDQGLFRLSKSSAELTQLTPALSIYDVKGLKGLKGWLVAAAEGIFWLSSTSNHLARLSGPLGTLKEISRLATREGATRGYWISGDNANYMIDGELKWVLSAGPLTDKYEFDVQGRDLVLASKSFVGRAIMQLPQDAVRFLSIQRVSPENARMTVVSKWEFSHICADQLGSMMLGIAAVPSNLPTVAVQPRATNLVQFSKPGQAVITGVVEYELTGPNNVRDWLVHLVLWNNIEWTTIGTYRDRFFLTWSEWLKANWNFVVAATSVAYLGVFAALFLSARYSTVAFRLLCDPVWSRVGGWPFFLLRHSTRAQLWVLEPFVRKDQSVGTANRQYLEVVIQSELGQQLEATQLLARLSSVSRIWLEGRAGMGKSSIFAAILKLYQDHVASESIFAIYRKLGFVLVSMRARQYATLPAESNSQDKWIIDAIRKEFQKFDFDISFELVRAMCTTGALCVAIDGMNEVDRDEALIEFVRAFPRVRMIVTSQTLSPVEASGRPLFEQWRLPPDIHANSQGLLSLWLGDDRGQELYRQINEARASRYLQSGYDLRLIADLSRVAPEGKPVPDSRIALYRAVLAAAVGGRGIPIDRLKKTAWLMFLERRREIFTDDITNIGRQLFPLLEQEPTRIVRKVRSVYEFRHDQMRAYLAAAWVGEEMANVSAMIEMIKNGAVWTSSRKDQDELWRFLSEILVSPIDLVALWRWSLEDPLRANLQYTLFERGRDLGLTMTASEQATH